MDDDDDYEYDDDQEFSAYDERPMHPLDLVVLGLRFGADVAESGRVFLRNAAAIVGAHVNWSIERKMFRQEAAEDIERIARG